MNACNFIGNLTRDVELRYTNSGKAVANFCLAVNTGSYKKDDQWVNEVAFLEFEAWDTGAERLAEHAKKGTKLAVESSIKEETWEKDGQKRKQLKFRCNRFDILSGRVVKDEAPQEEPVVAGQQEGGEVGGKGSTDDIPF
jgi:single-strand DNA-binding protein